MREMKDVWKEMKHRADEEQPLTEPKLNSKSSKTKAQSPAAASEETDLLDTGFTLREIGPSAIRLWLGFQVASLFFQLLLWNEVSGHLAEFEEAIGRECAPDRLQHGVCHGPMWNLTTWQDFVLPGQGWANSHTFTFTTRSSPPTFLLVVDPVSKAKVEGGADPAPAPTELADQTADLRDVRWSVELVRSSPPQLGPIFHQLHSGQKAMTIEDLSVEARQAVQAGGRVEWRATVQPHDSRKKRARYVAFVEDATSIHLDEVHNSAHCSFGSSWKAFNEQHQGHAHRALSWCRFLLGVFLLVGSAAVYVVHQELQRDPSRRYSTGTYYFHLVVAAKFVLQDVPQQVCIVLYVFGWYEASGLRCQLCMFNPQHCVYEEAFHSANAVAFTFVLLSSLANQLLVRPVFKRTYTEDDICLQYCVRVAPCTCGRDLHRDIAFHHGHLLGIQEPPADAQLLSFSLCHALRYWLAQLLRLDLLPHRRLLR